MPNKLSMDIVKKIEKELVDQGLSVEAGWMGLKLMAIPDDASQIQIDEMKWAFFAGALHIFETLMSILEEGAEPTDNDMRRMDLIHQELMKFKDDMLLRASEVEGSA